MSTSSSTVGRRLDSLNGVYVYYNKSVKNVSGRNIAPDGYNLGLKYQCVEFVKRYYYQHLNHKMPNSYGHAKSYFNKNLKDGQNNKARGLVQYCNGSKSKPKVDDLLIFDGTTFNQFGHVAIISRVTDSDIEIVQQNAGPLGQTRAKIMLKYEKGKWTLINEKILGWLRKSSHDDEEN